MKKAKKLLALISSAVMIASIGAMSVSAGTTEKIIYNTDSNGYSYPVKQTIETIFKGIIVTMPDGEAPTAEELCIENAEISAYTSNIGFIGLGGSFANGIYMGGSITTPVGSDCTYLINGEDLTEEKAVELIKLWKIRGIVETAEIFYETHMSNGELLRGSSENDVTLFLSFKYNDVDDSNLYEDIIAESEFSIYSLEVEDTRFRLGLSYDSDKYDLAEAYKMIMELCDKIKESDKSVIDISPIWFYLVSDTMSNGLYNVEPTWGDATNDDKVDLYDAIEIAKYIMDISEFDEDVKLLADINRDGVTDLYDAIEIARIIMEESKAG